MGLAIQPAGASVQRPVDIREVQFLRQKQSPGTLSSIRGYGRNVSSTICAASSKGAAADAFSSLKSALGPPGATQAPNSTSIPNPGAGKAPSRPSAAPDTEQGSMNPPGPDTVQEMTDQGHSVNTHWAGGPQSQGDSSIVYVQDGGGAPGEGAMPPSNAPPGVPELPSLPSTPSQPPSEGLPQLPQAPKAPPSSPFPKPSTPGGPDLPSLPQPEAPPVSAPLQDASSSLSLKTPADSLQDAGQGAQRAAQSAQQAAEGVQQAAGGGTSSAAADSLSERFPDFGAVRDAASGAASQAAGTGPSENVQGLQEAGKQAGEAATRTFRPLQDAFDFEDVPGIDQSDPLRMAFRSMDAVGESGDSLKRSLFGSFSGLKQSLSDATGGASDAVNAYIKQLQDAASSATSSSQGTANDVAIQAGDAASAAAGDFRRLAGGVGQQVNAAADGAVQQLPEPVREVLGKLRQPLQDAVSAVASDTRVLTAASGAFLLLLAASWVSNRSGFAGYLEPQQALDLLRRQNACLIDTRPEEQRAADGIPELRFGARGKGAAFEVLPVAKQAARQLRGGSDIAFTVAALQIRGLRQVGGGTRVIIVEARESGSSKKLARAVQQESGCSCYVLQGGYAAWQAAGLPTRSTGLDYETTPREAVLDSAEAVQSTARSVARSLSDPVNIYFGTLAAVGGVSFVRDWHATLQTVGLWGVLLSTTNWALSTKDPAGSLWAVAVKTADVAATPLRAVLPRPSSARPAAAAAAPSSAQAERASSSAEQVVDSAAAQAEQDADALEQREVHSPADAASAGPSSRPADDIIQQAAEDVQPAADEASTPADAASAGDGSGEGGGEAEAKSISTASEGKGGSLSASFRS